MSDELNSSLDSLELDLYHKPNPRIRMILNYLRAQNIKFCTDPKKKEEDYYFKGASPEINPDLDFGMRKNRFLKRGPQRNGITLVSNTS
ncbi:unnamed protein product (macronuclear) [Paramecium tetraurelia]|uniref:LisH domain-containing protein n=1 Tax=Paramecium tetraurelia TaxID=5888 RepID=A0CJT8_PARTE|nr:uncharacterized protein GSPATT00000767001 [Paramecium tetraurelia]CAK71055.1 unnamed protein product [Paramecium tetraurelia]|eukprot:XP_001438452.1 hypothetical protein (macronuclear) [Paramecium tetraurelia strain d4-2]